MTDEIDQDLSENSENSQEKQEQPWLKQPGEPETWYLRFHQFCRMGAGRSLLGLYNAERVTKGRKKALHASGTWRRRAVQYDWLTRASAYDRYIDKRDQAAWEKRRKDYRKRETEYAETLLKKAEQMLQFPLAKTEQETHQDGGRTVVTNVIMPARWGIRDAAQMIETADKLYRLALELETSRAITDVTVTESLDEIRDKRWRNIEPLLPDILAEDDNEQPNGTQTGTEAGSEAEQI